MAVRASDFVVCPACNSRNNPKREFCGRCGESLAGATLTTAAPLFPTDAEPEPEAPTSGGTGLFGDLVGLAAALLILAVGWRVARGATSTPSPALFTLATQPPRPATAATTTPELPGARDFEEGRSLLARGDAARAISPLSRAVSAAPSNALFHEVLGQAFWAVGSREQALAQLGEAARLDRRQFGKRLAERLAEAGRDTDAARAYSQLLSVNPDDPVAQESLAHTLYRLGDYANAVPVLQRVVQTRPDDPVLRQELGYALQATGDVAGAIDAYRSVLAKIPGADVARGLLTGLLYEQGKEEEAIALAREGIALNPGAANLRLHLANMLERSGRPGEAAPEYREYARLLPQAPDAKELEERADRLQGSSGGS
jgi:Flp pilus assembly protein TadD